MRRVQVGTDGRYEETINVAKCFVCVKQGEQKGSLLV